jgi:DNA replication protein DnaC
MPDCGIIKQRVLQLSGSRAPLEKPERLNCLECGKTLTAFSIHWPAGATKIECWPFHVCDDCITRAERSAEPIRDRLARTGILGRNRFCTFETFRPNNQKSLHAKTQAQTWGHNPQGTLWLCGGAGTGKTHLAVAIAQRHIDSGKTVIFAEVPYLLDRLTEDYLADDSPLIRESRWAECDLLILDDLGAEKQTEHKVERLTMLVNERIQQSRPMIVTSNYRPEKMLERISDRLLSRLQENGVTIDTGTQDYRRLRKEGLL